jgi:hypothetical protein
VHELVVVRETLDRQGVVGSPPGPALLEALDTRVTQLDQTTLNSREVFGAVAVEDDLSARDDAFRVEQPFDLDVVDAGEPLAWEGDGSRDMTPSSRLALAPAVVGG